MSYRNLVMRLAATLADIPLQLQRIWSVFTTDWNRFRIRFRRNCWTDWRRGDLCDASSACFNLGLDMLMGKAEREDNAQPFPQNLHAFYLSDMLYQPF